jgi:hypothetical protein
MMNGATVVEAWPSGTRRRKTQIFSSKRKKIYLSSRYGQTNRSICLTPPMAMGNRTMQLSGDDFTGEYEQKSVRGQSHEKLREGTRLGRWTRSTGGGPWNRRGAEPVGGGGDQGEDSWTEMGKVTESLRERGESERKEN